MIILPIINSHGSYLSSELNSFLSDIADNLERKNELLNLYNELKDLDVAPSASPSSAVTQAKREQVTLEIEMTEQHKARAAQFRARARWLKKGEKNTKYFLNPEKPRANVKIIDSLK